MGDVDVSLLDALYSGATDSEEFKRAMLLVGQQLSCSSSVLISLDPHSPGASLLLSTGAFDGPASQHYAELAPFDPAPATFTRLARGSASTTDRLLTAEQLRDGLFLNEFYRPRGFVETLGGHLQSDHANFALVGFHRGKDRPPFGDDDISYLERLMPHISRALSLRREFIGLQTKLTGLQGALDHLAAGIVLLDPNGRALFANTAIRAMARRNDGLSLDRAGFPIPAAMAERQRFDAMIAAVLAGGPGGTLRVSRKSDAQPYAVLVSPAPTSLLELNGEQRAHAGILIVVHDPSAQMRTDPALLQDALGLTPGAAKLVTALAGDDDLKSFAEREGITIHTARFHLRTALARTGTRTQAQLVRLAVRLLAELRLRSTDR
jgi:DNA-binding CsgD family transcriptional regulator